MEVKYLTILGILAILSRQIMAQEEILQPEFADHEEQMQYQQYMEAMNDKSDDLSQDALEENMNYDDYYKTDKSSGPGYLITRLKDPVHVLEDIQHDYRVVIFIENDPESLVNKEEGQGLARAQLISKLKFYRKTVHVDTSTFYFSDCTVLGTICEEMMVDPQKNQVIILSKYKVIHFDMATPSLADDVWEKLSQTLVELDTWDDLEEFMKKNNGEHLVLFNLDLNNKGEFKKRQKDVALNFIDKCKTRCLKEFEFVAVKNKNDFLNDPKNKQKTYLLIDGKKILLPLKLKGKRKEYRQTLEMVNTESLEEVMVNNNENHFKIYENNLKGMLVLVINTDDSSKVDPIMEDFKRAARDHKRQRTVYLDRYAFIIVDLHEGEKHYNDMFIEVSGEVTKDVDIFLLNHGTEETLIQNYRLEPNLDDISHFLSNLKEKVQEYKRIKAVYDVNDSDDKLENSKAMNDQEQTLLLDGNMYAKEWESLLNEYENQESTDNELNYVNMMALLYMKDIEQLFNSFHKSEEVDDELNEQNVTSGILNISRSNFEKYIHNSIDILSHQAKDININFLLLVCKNMNQDDMKQCLERQEIMKIIREANPSENFRMGMMDYSKNDHDMVERFLFKQFPAFIFYGVNDKVRRGKTYRSGEMKDYFMDWINEKLEQNNDKALEFTPEQNQRFLSIVSPEDV
jgi:hypothetical protein